MCLDPGARHKENLGTRSEHSPRWAPAQGSRNPSTTTPARRTEGPHHQPGQRYRGVSAAKGRGIGFHANKSVFLLTLFSLVASAAAVGLTLAGLLKPLSRQTARSPLSLFLVVLKQRVPALLPKLTSPYGMAELANWVIQWGPNPWGPNSCRSIQQADLEFGRLKEMAKSKLFSRKSLKCAGAWAVWLAANSQAEEKEAAQAEIQRLKEENGKLKAEIKAQRLKLEEGKTRESIAAVEQVRSVLQYQEVCEQKKAIMSENVALKDKLAVSTRAIEEFQGAIRALVQKIQALKEKGADHRACEARVEKLKAALGAKHSTATTALAKTSCQGGGEPWDGVAGLDPEGSPCEEKCGAVSQGLPAYEGGQGGQAGPAVLPGTQDAAKKESGGMEDGESRGDGQLQADGGTGGEPSGAPALQQHKAASSRAAGPAWAREDGGGSGKGRGGKGWRNPENKKGWGALHSPGMAAAPPLLPSGGRWPGRRPWQSGTGPRLGARSNVARRELGTMRVDIWRQLRQHGEDMARWDNAPTRALLERLLELSGSRDGGRAAAPALPVVV
ncbi:uncharacterized protein LOC107310886 [Coturnix japonica]|uniref:uncharacterized protein LOC107310886 n=1 Tax=Coturnix japonica TaxID=93934 RepID=UPI000776CCCE|nr:uncharacterized protein LOC107310886 [Coturnix japonica]XP_015712442.1 uncharacterized protein LOC107310886 [Coturnix japonica]XP_015712443.1 uncharacterized protein LOC107310886 [Coturnix japonica]